MPNVAVETAGGQSGRVLGGVPGGLKKLADSQEMRGTGLQKAESDDRQGRRLPGEEEPGEWGWNAVQRPPRLPHSERQQRQECDCANDVEGHAVVTVGRGAEETSRQALAGPGRQPTVAHPQK